MSARNSLPAPWPRVKKASWPSTARAATSPAGGALPGRRSNPGARCRRSLSAYVPGRQRVRGLLVAALWEGRLRYVAYLRSGLPEPERRHLASILAPKVRPRPAVACPERGVWVEPVVYCQVRFLEWTRAGMLRGARFCGLLHPSDVEPQHLLR